MANENNNINELVADDDPTAELELPAFAGVSNNDSEVGARTFDAGDSGENDDTHSRVTLTELRSDLKSRQKTIGQLQYDIDQLHARWLGLEAEIGARESQTEQLNDELRSAQTIIVRKERLIKKRDRNIKSLKTEIRQRDEEFRQLNTRHNELQQQIDEQAATASPDPESLSPTPNHSSDDLQQRLHRAETYADSLRQNSQDYMESNSRYERENAALSRQLADAQAVNDNHIREAEQSSNDIQALQSQLDSMQTDHENEIRLLRFELSSAQDTVVETEELNNQLASDLVGAQGSKAELERELGHAAEQSSAHSEKMRKQIGKLKRQVESYEQKLTTKSEAISVLLSELARKTEQLESIDEIEDVIHDIDERMSERSARNNREEQRSPADRVSRVLVGTVDGQVLRFPLFKDRLTIGRTTDNDIQLKAAYVSRRHAVIQTDGETTRIIDWGSTNGIYVNSEKISEYFLNHCDIVTIGNARFRYEERKKRDA